MSCKQCRDLQRTYEACYSYAFDATATHRISPQCPDCAARLREQLAASQAEGERLRLTSASRGTLIEGMEAETERLCEQLAKLEAENERLRGEVADVNTLWENDTAYAESRARRLLKRNDEATRGMSFGLLMTELEAEVKQLRK